MTISDPTASIHVLKKATCPTLSGKSVNTPAFLLAVLKHEDLLRPMKGKKRSHELVDSQAFIDKVNNLMASNAGGATWKTTKKAPIKKKASTSRRKQP